MIVAQYFVEFMFYSFLGWVWESIYCTAKNKAWQDRGFLFGPICPIYGSCVILVKLLFELVPSVSSPDFPVWAIFLICMIGSAIAEFCTSWVLEKRFHAMWWDYSKLPLNIQGRICLPVSIGFGLAGVAIVKFLFPLLASLETGTPHPLIVETVALIGAMILGADYALTEASLSNLLHDIEEMKAEMNRRWEEAYENTVQAPKRLSEDLQQAREDLQENLADRAAMLRTLSDAYADNLGVNQKRIFHNIQRFKPAKEERRFSGISPTEHLRNSLKEKRKQKKQKKHGK